MVQTKLVSITEVVAMLEDRKNKNPKVALLLGSRAGALFRSENLYQQFVDEQLIFYSTRALADMKPWERFTEYYNILKQSSEEIGKSDLIAILKHALSGINFSKADFSLAELIKQGIFKLIVSTNVDELLYDAMATLDMKEGRDFVNFTLASNLIQDEIINEIVFHSKQDACKIIRISNEARQLVYMLTQPDAQEENGSFVRRLLERLRIKEVLVIGLDPLWDGALMAELSERIKTVWFINEDREVMNQFLANKQKHLELCNYIFGENGSYEKFLMALYWEINKDIPRHYDLLIDVMSQMHAMQGKLNTLESEILQMKNMLRKLVNSIEAQDREKRQSRRGE